MQGDKQKNVSSFFINNSVLFSESDLKYSPRFIKYIWNQKEISSNKSKFITKFTNYAKQKRIKNKKYLFYRNMRKYGPNP